MSFDSLSQTDDVDTEKNKTTTKRKKEEMPQPDLVQKLDSCPLYRAVTA